MPSGYGVQWEGEAKAVQAVVDVVAFDFAERLSDEVEALADNHELLAAIADPLGRQSSEYAFQWFAYAVTVTVRVSDRFSLLYVDRVTIATSVGGVNPFA
jgi:hypothetical protein